MAGKKKRLQIYEKSLLKKILDELENQVKADYGWCLIKKETIFHPPILFNKMWSFKEL